MSEKIWFITGARGFGRIWAEAALERGDKVVATVRNLASLAAGWNSRVAVRALALAFDRFRQSAAGGLG